MGGLLKRASALFCAGLLSSLDMGVSDCLLESARHSLCLWLVPFESDSILNCDGWEDNGRCQK